MDERDPQPKPPPTPPEGKVLLPPSGELAPITPPLPLTPPASAQPAAEPAPPQAPRPDTARLWGMGEVLRLSLPTSMTMINSTAMSFVDGLMVAHMGAGGPEAFAAQAPAGIIHFTFISLIFGVLTVVNTYVAQNLGAGRRLQCGQYTWAGLYLAAAAAVLLLPLAFLAGPMFSLLGHAASVQALETMYFRYMVGGTVLFLVSHVLQQHFFGTHRPMIVFGASLVANLCNLAGAYALIYGKWGLPAWGLEGAAIATVASTGVLVVFLGAAFLTRAEHGRCGTRGPGAVRLRQLKDILRVGLFAGLQTFIDVLGWAVFIAILVGGVQTVHGTPSPDASTIHLAATNVASRYMSLSFMPAAGISIAVTALVGRLIGTGQRHLVRRRVWAAVGLAVLYMGTCGLAFGIWRRELVLLFFAYDPGVEPAARQRIAEIVAIGGPILICAAVFQVFDAIGIVFSGALRGAGDTFWPALLSLGLIALVLFGGGWLLVTVAPRWESLGPWIAGSAYVILLGLLLMARFLRGRWQRIDLLH